MRHRVFAQLNPPRRSGSILRMAPLIDMMFLLLIFLLLAAKFGPQEDYLPMRLPAAQGSQVGQMVDTGGPHRDRLSFFITPTETGCAVQIGELEPISVKDSNSQADLAALLEKIRETLVAQQRSADDPVEIICDKHVRWEHVARIYSLFCSAALTDITFRMTE